MSSVPASSPVPRRDLVVPRGASRTIQVDIAKDGANVNLSAPGIQVIFTAKVSDRDVIPAIQKSYAATGTPAPLLSAGGITAVEIDTNGDSIADSWVALIEIAPADTETVDAPYLSYDVWLVTLSGREVPVVEGRLRITPTTFRP